MLIFIANVATDSLGDYTPDVPVGTEWVGNLYEKQGNVRKYLLKTPTDISGHPGVFGPIDPADVQAAITADGGTLRGWQVDEVPSWTVGG